MTLFYWTNNHLPQMYSIHYACIVWKPKVKTEAMVLNWNKNINHITCVDFLTAVFSFYSPSRNNKGSQHDIGGW